MKRVDKILLSLFIGPLVITFLVADFIFLMMFLFKYIDDMVGKGIEFSLIGKLIGLYSMTILPLALPLAILLASNMTLGGLAERSELIAFKTAGISLSRIIQGLFIFILLLSAGAFFFSNNVLPWTNLQFYSLLHDIRRHKPALDIEEGVFYNGINGFTFKIGSKEDDNRQINNIMVYDHTSGKGNDNLVMADKGELVMTNDGKYLIMTLYEGKQYKDVKQRTVKDNKKMYERVEMEFREFRKVFDLSEFEMDQTDTRLWKDNYHMLNIQQLTTKNDSLVSDIDKVKRKVQDYTKSFLSITNPAETDSILKVARSYEDFDLDSLSIDSVMASPLTMEIKNKAIDNARNVRSYAESMANQIQYKEKAMAYNLMMIHKKFTLSIACIVLFLIGAPMGAIIRKGGFGMPILVSIAFFITFHVLSITGEKLVKQMIWSPALGMWFPLMILTPIGIFLTYKATKDSRLFNFDSMTRALKNFGPIARLLKKEH
ncbi:MAG: LptF/LptG family permease [Chitinophagales bacterium]